MDLRTATQQMRRDGMDYIAISRELEIPLAEVIAYSREVAPGPTRQADNHPKLLEAQATIAQLKDELAAAQATIAQLKDELAAAQATIAQLNKELLKISAPTSDDLEWSRWMTAGAVSAKLGIAGHVTIWKTCALGHDLDGRYFEARYVRPTDINVNHGTIHLIRYSLLPSDIKTRHQR